MIYTKESLIEKLKDFYTTFNRVPTKEDLALIEGYPLPKTLKKHFGSYENAIKEAGLSNFITNKNHSIKERYDIVKISNGTIFPFDDNEKIFLLNKLYNFYLKLGRCPTTRDVDLEESMPSVNIYLSRFGKWYDAIDLAKIPHNKRNFALTNQEIINKWQQIKDNLGRVPSFLEIQEVSGNVSYSIIKRWGNYTEFLLKIGETKFNNIYTTPNNNKCKSFAEYKITTWLEENKINFLKDVEYASILQNDSTKRTLDWMVIHKNKIYYIEYFGLDSEEYLKKKDQKIKDFQGNGLELISIEPKDLMNLEIPNVLSFLN